MSKILLIETSSEICSVGLAEDNILKIIYEEKAGNIHAARAPEFVANIMKNHDVDAVAVSSGPGSYTGLRIGVSLAKGITYAAGIPLISVPTLDAIVSYITDTYPVESGAVIIPTVDARRMEIYTAVYDYNGNKLTEVQPLIVEEDSFKEFSPSFLYIAGNGAEKTFNKITFHNKYLIKVVPSVRNMVKIAFEKFKSKNFEDVAYFEPFYLKQFLVTTPKKKLLE